LFLKSTSIYFERRIFPFSKAELSFQVGEGFVIHGEPDESGFYYGQRERDGRHGYVPSNYFRDAGPPPRDSTSFRESSPAAQPLQRQNIAADDQRRSMPMNINAAEARLSSHSIGREYVNRDLGNDFQGHDGRRQQNVVGVAAVLPRDLGGPSSAPGVRSNSGERPRTTVSTTRQSGSGSGQSELSGAMFEPVGSRGVTMDSSGSRLGGGGAVMDSSAARGAGAGAGGGMSNSAGSRGGAGGGDMQRKVDRPPDAGMDQKRRRP